MTNIHAAIEATIIVCAAALAFGMYLYGQYVARREAKTQQAGPMEALRTKCRAHHKRIFKLNQSIADLVAENDELCRQLKDQADTDLDDRHTLLRAGRELQVASNTYKALNSKNHALTAAALSKQLHFMASRYQIPAPDADALTNQAEKAA